MKSVDRSEELGPRAIPRGSFLGSVLRLGLFLSAIGAVTFGLLLRSVRADVTELLSKVGEQMMEYPGAPQEPVRQLQLNGVRVSFRTQTVNAPFSDVLAHYETVCGTPAARLANPPTNLSSAHSNSLSIPEALRAMATQAVRNQSVGHVACLDFGDAPQDLGALASRFLSFARTGDLRAVGKLRYVRARRIAGSSNDKTLLFTMWADSAIHLDRMLPHASADAAGHDLVGVPRPAGSQRILSAWEAQQPTGVFVYRVPASSAANLESFYRDQLPRSGWRIIERNPTETIQVDGIRMLSAEKNNRHVTVLAHPGEGLQTLLTVLASGPS